MHELDGSPMLETDFSVKDVDNMPIDDIAMITQWKTDSKFKVIIDLKVSRNKVGVIEEVSSFHCSSININSV